MARRAEEEENHWPGFVDALSTIVMVVTFLLIILGIVIFVISLQINDPTDRDSKAASGIQIAELEFELAQVIQTVSQQTEVIDVQEQELAEIIEVVSQQTEVIEEQEMEIEELAETVSQASAVDAGNVLEVQAPTPIVETEIVVFPSKEDTQSSAETSQIETAQAVMTVRFEENAVELDEESKEQALNFLDENSVIADEQNVLAISYYDGEALSVSQEKRTAYYRLLSVRNALLDSGVDGERITISVKATQENTDGGDNSDRVKVFLQ